MNRARTLPPEADHPAFAEGWDAFRAGRVGNNPYAETEAKQPWAAGWYAAIEYQRAVDVAKLQGGEQCR